MYRESVELCGRHPADLRSFVTLAERASDEFRAEEQGELLSDFSIVVGDDMVGVGIHADEFGNPDVVAGLFAGLAFGGVGDVFADLLDAAGECPQSVV
jgi:hypothetical protein